MKRTILLFLCLIFLNGCFSVGGSVRAKEVLFTSLQRDFPEIWNSAIYVLHKREYEIIKKDRGAKRITAEKYNEDVRVLLHFTNPIEETTEVRLKVYRDGEIDFREGLDILRDIERNQYRSSLFPF